MKFKASLNNYIFGLVNIAFAIVSGIALVPLYLHYIDLSTYGAWLAISNVVLIIGSVESGFGLVMTQNLSEAFQSNDQSSIKNLNGCNIAISGLIAILIIFIGVGLASYIPTWVNAPANSIDTLYYATVISVLSAAIGVIAGQVGIYAQVWQMTFSVGVSNLIASLLSVLLIVLLFYFGYGLLSLAYGNLFRMIFRFGYLLVFNICMWKKLNMPMFDFRLPLIKKMIVLSSLPFLSRISSLVVNNSQVFMASLYISPSIAAIYDITSKVITVCSLMMSNLNGSIFASTAHIFASKNKSYIKSSLSELFEITNSSYYWAIIFCILFTKDVVTIWVGSDLFGGAWINCLIIFSVVLRERKSLLQILLFSFGSFKPSSKVDILTSFLYIVLLVITVPYLGIISIPLSSIITSISCIYFYDKLILKQLNLNWTWMYSIAKNIFFVSFVTGILFFFIPNFDDLRVSIIMKVLFFGIVCSFSQLYFSPVTKKIIVERILKIQ